MRKLKRNVTERLIITQHTRRQSKVISGIEEDIKVLRRSWTDHVGFDGKWADKLNVSEDLMLMMENMLKQMTFSVKLSCWSASQCAEYASISCLLTLLWKMALEEEEHAKPHIIELVNPVVETRLVLISEIGWKQEVAFGAVVLSFEGLD